MVSATKLHTLAQKTFLITGNLNPTRSDINPG